MYGVLLTCLLLSLIQLSFLKLPIATGYEPGLATEERTNARTHARHARKRTHTHEKHTNERTNERTDQRDKQESKVARKEQAGCS